MLCQILIGIFNQRPMTFRIDAAHPADVRREIALVHEIRNDGLCMGRDAGLKGVEALCKCVNQS